MSQILCLALLCIFSTTAFAAQIDSMKEKYLSKISLEAPIYPSWVHLHWVWENEGDQQSAMQLVDDYTAKNIPVGALVIDRPWDVAPNSFVPSPILYPDLASYIQKFHDKNVKVLMWATSMINQEAPNFAEAKAKGYFLKGKTDIDWWGGVGGLLDYDQPEAVAWWHKQMDRVLDMKIDGWKVDATDPAVLKMYNAVEAIPKWVHYKKLEYNDFFHYTREKLGNDRVIMARPVDDYVGLGLPVTFASTKINYAGWVGDQDGSWAGLKHALVNMLASANLKYPVIGSDIGGFRTKDGQFIREKALMVRWTQLGALMPLMENGGDGEHRPWKYDQEVEDIYRKYVHFHNNLLPYIYSQTAMAIQAKRSPIRTLAKKRQYLLGDSLFVSPIYTNSNTVDLCLPDGEWKQIFHEDKTLSGCLGKKNFALEDYPAYLKVGSLIPMNVDSDETGFGTESSKDHLTVVLYPKALKGKETSEQIIPVFSDKQEAGLISYHQTGNKITFESKGIKKSILYRVYSAGKVTWVKTAGTASAAVDLN